MLPMITLGSRVRQLHAQQMTNRSKQMNTELRAAIDAVVQAQRLVDEAEITGRALADAYLRTHGLRFDAMTQARRRLSRRRMLLHAAIARLEEITKHAPPTSA